ncbi:MAG: sensor histidine kinase [Ginsengibacter sp.]
MFKSDQEIYFTVIAGGAVMVMLVSIIIIAVIKYQNRIYKHRKEQAQLHAKFSQTLLESQLEIQEQTLRHISTELHDNLGQVASLIKINLFTIDVTEPDKANEKIENTKELTRQLLTDIKSLSVSLSSDRIAKAGLSPAIETEVDRLNKTGQFVATFTEVGHLPILDNDKATILYRMAQEVLNNMVKHSRAKKITVLLNASEKFITLTISDNGIGFSISEKMNSGGAGLANLQNRAALINAKLHMQSAPGEGSQTTIELPV